MNSPHMFSHGAFCSVPHCTILTWEAASLVFVHVRFVVCLFIEASAADLTIITVLSCVNLHVPGQVVFIGKHFFTQITWKSLCYPLS